MGLATFEATANIAVAKYWGKRDEKLILPKEGSLSFTMDDQLKTRTSVLFSPALKEDEFWLNGKKMDMADKDTAERLQQIEIIRQKAGIKDKAKIVSLNCFPTAAGFASSAAGLAALACAASKAAGLDLSTEELSILARLGSGSACRSVLGGFVEWKKGIKPDGSDSYAEQIAPASRWPELRNVIAIGDSGKKKVSSRAGMKQTVATSALYPARLAYMPKLITDMKAAVAQHAQTIGPEQKHSSVAANGRDFLLFLPSLRTGFGKARGNHYRRLDFFFGALTENGGHQCRGNADYRKVNRTCRVLHRRNALDAQNLGGVGINRKNAPLERLGERRRENAALHQPLQHAVPNGRRVTAGPNYRNAGRRKQRLQVNRGKSPSRRLWSPPLALQSRDSSPLPKPRRARPSVSRG